jgi:hypothetical protein
VGRITETTCLSGTNVITNTWDLADELLGRASAQSNRNQTASYWIAGIVTDTYNALDQLTNLVGPGINVNYIYVDKAAVLHWSLGTHCVPCNL